MLMSSERSVSRSPRQWLVLVLLGLLPGLMGGCPEFRNDLVNIANDATQSVVLGGETEESAWDTAVRGALGAAIDLFYDQFRDESVR